MRQRNLQSINNKVTNFDNKFKSIGIFNTKVDKNDTRIRAISVGYLSIAIYGRQRLYEVSGNKSRMFKQTWVIKLRSSDRMRDFSASLAMCT